MIDFKALWLRVEAECAPKNPYSVHGSDHWRRVERNGLILATRTGANVDVVRLFVLFHDCQRLNDGWDPEHGERGAVYVGTLRGDAFDLSNSDFELLRYACTWHTDGGRNDDPTIGTCWDADRLDLGRVGLIPDAQVHEHGFRYGNCRPWRD